MKFLAAGLLLLLVLLQYRLWLGEGGMREVAQLREEISAQREENGQLRERNRTLAAEVQDLKKGTTAIEERARTDLGMIGQGETFYQVVEPRRPVPDADESVDEPVPPVEAPPAQHSAPEAYRGGDPGVGGSDLAGTRRAAGQPPRAP